MTQPILQIRELTKHFPIGKRGFGRSRSLVKAVNRISFDIGKGEVVGLVGESGSGKTTVGRLILRLLGITSGQVLSGDVDLTTLSGRDLLRFRKQFQIVFQDPFSSLNKYFTIERILTEPMVIHGIGQDAGERRALAAHLLERVGLPSSVLSRYPHEFSGGQRQRIGISRALATSPDFIVADEAVSALDVSIQAQVLNILLDLKEEDDLTMLFITHDLSVVKYVADRVVVMYLGHIMEIAPTEALFADPLHPYSKFLLSAAPSIERDRRLSRMKLSGEIPSPLSPPSGCPFRTRCPSASRDCAVADMAVREKKPGRFSSCIL